MRISIVNINPVSPPHNTNNTKKHTKKTGRCIFRSKWELDQNLTKIYCKFTAFLVELALLSLTQKGNNSDVFIKISLAS